MRTMLTNKFVAATNALLESLESAKPLWSALEMLSLTEGAMDDQLKRIATGGNDLSAGAQDLHSLLVSLARQNLPKIPSRAFYRSIEDVSSALQRYHSEDPSSRKAMVDLAGRLDAFSHDYELYLAEQTGKRAIPVLREAPRLLALLTGTLVSLHIASNDLSEAHEIGTDEETYELFFEGEHTLEEVAAKLRALATIFEAVTRLIDPDRTSPSVRVLHVEAGSLRVMLAVAASVLAVAKPWINAIVGFLWRNHTIEGRLSTHPTIARAAIKQAIDVRAMLNKAGIQTTGMDANIERAAIAMTEGVVALVENQSRFTVDGKEVSGRRYEVVAELQYEGKQQLPAPIGPASDDSPT